MTAAHKAIATRDVILERALELFSSKGYLGATTKEIARVAGVAEVTLFRHFPSKEHLLEAVIQRYSFIPTLRELIPEIIDLPYEEGLQRIAQRLFETLLHLKDWIRIMHAEVQRSPEKLFEVYHGFLDRLFDTFALYFQAKQEQGEMRPFDQEWAARAFYGMIFSFFNMEEILLRKEYRAADREGAFREFVRIFAQGTAN